LLFILYPFPLDPAIRATKMTDEFSIIDGGMSMGNTMYMIIIKGVE